jgi:hypothetical protein
MKKPALVTGELKEIVSGFEPSTPSRGSPKPATCVLGASKWPAKVDMFCPAMKSGKVQALPLQAYMVLSARCNSPGEVNCKLTTLFEVFNGPAAGACVASPKLVIQLTGSLDRIWLCV